MSGGFAGQTKRYLLSLIVFAGTGLMAACSTVSASPTPIISDPGPAECFERILVVVWGDRNRDGIQDPDEEPLEDVLLWIAHKDRPVTQGVRFSTGTGGKAYFATRELENCLPRGYQVAFLRQVSGYEFPADPVVDLNDFDPQEDIVGFGLLPLRETETSSGPGKY